jgi:hypothetical protein
MRAGDGWMSHAEGWVAGRPGSRWDSSRQLPRSVTARPSPAFSQSIRVTSPDPGHPDRVAGPGRDHARRRVAALGEPVQRGRPLLQPADDRRGAAAVQVRGERFIVAERPHHHRGSVPLGELVADPRTGHRAVQAPHAGRAGLVLAVFAQDAAYERGVGHRMVVLTSWRHCGPGRVPARGRPLRTARAPGRRERTPPARPLAALDPLGTARRRAERPRRSPGTPLHRAGGPGARCHTAGTCPCLPSSRLLPGSRGRPKPAGRPGLHAATGCARAPGQPAAYRSDSRASGPAFLHQRRAPPWGGLSPARRAPSGSRRCRAPAGSG